jgi:hypothetical protein
LGAVVTTRNILSTLQQLLGYAVDRDMLSINVARGVRVIDRRDEGARKIVPPTKEAMRALLAVADEDFRFLVERHPTPPPSVGISWRNADRRSADRGPDRQRESAFRVPICLDAARKPLGIALESRRFSSALEISFFLL